jgi:hypothetical protein
VKDKKRGGHSLEWPPRSPYVDLKIDLYRNCQDRYEPRRNEEHSAAKPQPTGQQNFLLKKQEVSSLFHEEGRRINVFGSLRHLRVFVV